MEPHHETELGPATASGSGAGTSLRQPERPHGGVEYTLAPWCDKVTLVAASTGERFEAARNRLVRSPYFERLLSGVYMERVGDNGCIDVQDDPAVLAQLLAQLHVGCVDPLPEGVDSTSSAARKIHEDLSFYLVDMLPTLYETFPLAGELLQLWRFDHDFYPATNDKFLVVLTDGPLNKPYIWSVFCGSPDWRETVAHHVPRPVDILTENPGNVLVHHAVGPQSQPVAAMCVQHGVYDQNTDAIPTDVWVMWCDDKTAPLVHAKVSCSVKSLGVGDQFLAVGCYTGSDSARYSINVYALAGSKQTGCVQFVRTIPTAPDRCQTNWLEPSFTAVWDSLVSHRSPLPLHHGHSACFLDVKTGDIVHCEWEGVFNSAGLMVADSDGVVVTTSFSGLGHDAQRKEGFLVRTETSMDGVVVKYTVPVIAQADPVVLSRGSVVYEVYDRETFHPVDGSDSSEFEYLVYELASGRSKSFRVPRTESFVRPDTLAIDRGLAVFQTDLAVLY